MAIKTLEQLAQELNNLYPTSFSQFFEKQPDTFIVYFDVGEENFHADNVVQVEGLLVDIDLYSKTKNLVAERQIKDLLRAHETPYDKSDTIFIPDDGLYLTTFTVKLLNTYKTLEEL